MALRAFPTWRSLRVSVCVSSILLAPTSALAASTQPFTTLFGRSRAFSAVRKTNLKMRAGSSTTLEKDIADYNSCTSAAVTLSNAHVVECGPNMLLRLTRTVEDIDNDKRRSYDYIFPITSTSSGDGAFFQLPPTEISPNIQGQISSPSGKVMAIIRSDDAKDANSPARQVLEVWASDTGSGLPSTLVRRIALPADLHGKVLVDPLTFGRPSWSPDERVLVYVAERKKPETTSFFDPKILQKKDNMKIPGGQHTLGLGKTENWGEVLYSQEPLFDLFLVNIETGRVAKVENVPGVNDNEATSSIGSYALGTPVFSPDGKALVYTGWDAGGGLEMPKRLGLIHCVQRASKLYSSTISNLLDFVAQEPVYPLDKDEHSPKEESDYVCLTPSLRLARSPRFSPSTSEGGSKLVFLASQDGFDTHFGHFGLHSIEWKDGAAGSETVLVKQRWNIRDESGSLSEGVVGKIPFPGLSIPEQLPERGFVSPNTLVTCTIWGSSLQIVRICLKDGTTRLVRANIEGSDSWSAGVTTQELLCTTPSGGIILKETAPNQPGVIAYVEAQELQKDDVVSDGVKAVPIATLSPASASTCAPVPSTAEPLCGYSYQILTLERPDGENRWNAPIQCILILPNKKDGHPKPPLICMVSLKFCYCLFVRYDC